MTNSSESVPNRPESLEKPARLAESFAFCHDVARREAGNFYWSFRLLPRETRQEMCALYAFMRHTDDLADRHASAAEREADLDAWWASLYTYVNDANASGELPEASASAGKPGHALAVTLKRRDIPLGYLRSVIKGMAIDIGPVRIADSDQFEWYCWHVASVVGLCCLHIWGYEYRYRGGKPEALAERLGLAFQRTNILRDVAEDYALGRVYLPADELLRHNVSESDLAASRASAGLKSLVAEQVAMARAEYRAVDELLPLITPKCRPMLRAIARIYEAILDTIERQGYDVLARRAAIPKWRKAAIMIGAMFG